MLASKKVRERTKWHELPVRSYVLPSATTRAVRIIYNVNVRKLKQLDTACADAYDKEFAARVIYACTPTDSNKCKVQKYAKLTRSLTRKRQRIEDKVRRIITAR